jgi:putative redox protein
MPNQIEAKLTQVGPSTSEASIRTHTNLIDRPEAKGGADQGPMGGELLLASLAGCFMSNLLAAIGAREAAIENVCTHVAGTLDGTPTRFTAIAMEVSGEGADLDQLGKLVTIAERGCIVANTLRHAVELSVRVA